jgi:histidine triad (HIT) family protein
MTYDKNNVFAKILRGEIPNDTVYEDDYTLAFNDLYPKSKTHIIVIPKGEYSDFIDFNQNAKNDEIAAFFKTVSNIAKENDIASACQILANCGQGGGQEIPHFHVHLVEGQAVHFNIKQ